MYLIKTAKGDITKITDAKAKIRAIMQYARENGCSYDKALILAKTGKKMF